MKTIPDGVRAEEILIARMADMLDGLGHIAVGASSPVPGSAAMLARERHPERTRVSVLGSAANNFFTDGGKELFDCAGQGRIDAFFLGGAQIDGQANINLVSIGDPDKPRDPKGHISCCQCFHIRRVQDSKSYLSMFCSGRNKRRFLKKMSEFGHIFELTALSSVSIY